MKFTSKIISLLILSSIILLTPHKSPSQEVAKNIALIGALHNAQEIFGPLVYLNSKIFVDLNDVPQVYVFILCHPQNPVLDLDMSEDDIWGGFLSDYEQFGIVTVVAGANKSHVPVIQTYRGLPDYILNFTKIKTTIKQKSSKSGWNVIRYLYPTSLEFWLEFKIPTSPETLFVRASDMSIIDIEHVKQLQYNLNRQRIINSEKDRAERITRKWEFVESLYLDQIGERGDPAK